LNDENFYKQKNTTDGYSPYCRICQIKKQSIYQAGRRDHYNKIKKKHYRDNHDHYLEKHTDYRNVNKDYYSQKGKDFRKNNKDKIEMYNLKHRKHDVTKKEWSACKIFFGNKCACCWMSIDEHLVPRNGKLILMDFHKDHLHHNGKNDLSNCVPMCHYCNTSKHKKTINQFYNKNNPNYIYERYYKIYQWIRYEYKNHIGKEKKYKWQ
jgi:hypothetical protein